jgi:hypothetical protein
MTECYLFCEQNNTRHEHFYTQDFETIEAVRMLSICVQHDTIGQQNTPNLSKSMHACIICIIIFYMFYYNALMCWFQLIVSVTIVYIKMVSVFNDVMH